MSLGEGTLGGMRSARSEGSSGSGFDNLGCGEQTPRRAGAEGLRGNPKRSRGQ